MQGRGLLYRLSNVQGDSRPLDLRNSILAHLSVILNMRRDSSPTVPALGLPDFTDIAHLFPDAINELQRSVKETIEAYEPRLRDVVVRYMPDPEVQLQVRLEITALAVDSRARGSYSFSTTMAPGGQMNVR